MFKKEKEQPKQLYSVEIVPIRAGVEQPIIGDYIGVWDDVCCTLLHYNPAIRPGYSVVVGYVGNTGCIPDSPMATENGEFPGAPKRKPKQGDLWWEGCEDYGDEWRKGRNDGFT